MGHQTHKRAQEDGNRLEMWVHVPEDPWSPWRHEHGHQPEGARKWRDQAVKLRESGNNPSFQDMVEFVERLAQRQEGPVFELSNDKPAAPSAPSQQNKRGRVMVVHVAETQQETHQKTSCPICLADHLTTSCKRFRSATTDQRYQMARDNHLCFACLKTGHGIGECSERKACGKDGCDKRHHAMLHKTKKEQSGVRANPQNQGSDQQATNLGPQDSSRGR